MPVSSSGPRAVRSPIGALWALAAACAGSAVVPWAAAQPRDHGAPVAPVEVRCNEQRAQAPLIRGNMITKGRQPPDERRRRGQLHQQAIQYRTERYGYFAPFGRPGTDPRPPLAHAVSTRFFGVRVRLHERIVPAVRCVEAELRTACAAAPYEPRRLSGIRDHNTYHSGEISNHVYGIAIDVDPDRNTCCGCVPPWNDHPLCFRQVGSIFERMVMPECWIGVFERFGFYWLGRDSLQDTMHFEFLGDPERILVGAAAPVDPATLAPIAPPPAALPARAPARPARPPRR